MDFENILREMYSKLETTHNFILGPVDTDSVSFCKENGEEFTKEEQENLVEEINSFMPGFIRYAHDGYFPKILVLKAKNYITQDEKGKLKIKGSALKSSKTEKAVKEFMGKLIDHLLNSDDYDAMRATYHSYIKEIHNMTDISRWTSKKTLTEKVFTSTRTNETKILDAIQGEEDVQQGNKIHVYFNTQDKLVLEKNWTNDHNRVKMIARLYNTLKIFDAVLKIEEFPKYHLKNKKIQAQLQEILK